MTAKFKQRSLWDDRPPIEESPPADDGPPAEEIARLQAAFERRVLQGLAEEWKLAAWLLPDNLRRTLKRPLFAIGGGIRSLGSWEPGKRKITISRSVVSEGRWDDVREILLHEMAHQVAHEALRASSETDHGPGFHEACRLLRANPAASGSHRSLHDRLRRGEKIDANDRIVARIQKLMALSTSSNINEARAAMRKAYELIARYNVDLIDQGIEQEYVSVFLGTPQLRHFRESYHLAHLIQDFYFVQGIWVQAWVMEKGRMGRVLEISGSSKNVSVAEYVYAAVRHYIDTAWNDYRRDKRLNRYRKTDFAVGIIEGFRGTLDQACVSKKESTLLPARIEDTALTHYVSRRYPHIRSFSRQGPGHDAQVLADGAEQGKKLVIAKGISHAQGYRRRVLGYKK